MKIRNLLLCLPALLIHCSGEPVENTTPRYEIPSALSAADFPADIDMTSLARLPEVQREDLDAVGQDAFDTYVSPGTGYETGLRGPIGMWMHSPALAKALFPVRERTRYGSQFDQRLTELTIISTAREISNQYEYTAHEGPARVAGLEEEIIDFVKYRRDFADAPDLTAFGDTERLLIQFTRELISEEIVSAETFARVLDRFGREGVMDLVGLIGYYNFVAITLKAFDVHHPPGRDLLLPIQTH